MSREPLSAVDAVWFQMDNDAHPMVITSLLRLDGPLGDGAIADLVARLTRHRRFRQRVVRTHGPIAFHWEDDPGFDARLHVHRVGLPPPADDAALAAFVSDRMSTRLDPTRPLWEFHVVEGAKDGTVSIVTRIHHAMGDGVALVKVLLDLASESATPEAVGLPPPMPASRFEERVRRGAADVTALAHLTLLPFDTKTPLLGPASRRKVATWSRPYSVSALKRAAHAAGGKMNDVLLAAITAAVRRYLEACDAMKEGLEVRAIVPVFLRGIDAKGEVGGELGNHFGLVLVPLPLGVTAPFGRVAAVAERMAAIKSSADANVALMILGAAGAAGGEIERLVVDVFSSKASLLVTNVAGPPVPIAIAGRVVRDIMVWAPAGGHIGVSVSLLSYAGLLRAGVAGDVSRLADPEILTTAFERDLDALLAATAAPPPEARAGA